MKVQHLFLLLFSVGSILSANSDKFQISGTVTKKGGGPLEGVTVLLKNKNVSMTTKADGAFELSSSVAIRMRAPQTQTLSFTLQGNALAFSPGTGKLSGNVTIFSGNGKCLASTDVKLMLITGS
ncbi:MAG: carboxypeptidase-like regulatory domain-containing protein [Chitinispirillaceae bacterium]|nr:carboxypeptidase-like regulatory domain-containing protein [Chitinispirillaceae bacterium]